MIKDQLDWEIGEDIVKDDKGIWFRKVEISGVVHNMGEDAAGIAHCILLLIDSINDSKIGQPS